jgi:hypothetical protein
MSRLSKLHFWEWFKRNNQEFFKLKTKTKKELAYWETELNAHLRAYFKFFDFSLQINRNQTGSLTISVHGKAGHFKKVDALVAKAPKVDGWTFFALEPPRPIDFFLQTQIMVTGIDPREFKFSFAGNNPRKPVLFVYHPLYIPENR